MYFKQIISNWTQTGYFSFDAVDYEMRQTGEGYELAKRLYLNYKHKLTGDEIEFQGEDWKSSMTVTFKSRNEALAFRVAGYCGLRTFLDIEPRTEEEADFYVKLTVPENNEDPLVVRQFLKAIDRETENSLGPKLIDDMLQLIEVGVIKIPSQQTLCSKIS